MDAGDVNGAYNLGLLCAAQDRTAQAEQWYRRAAYAGHREAANALAVLLLQAGDAARGRAVVLQGRRGGQRGRRLQPRHPVRRAVTTTAPPCAGTSGPRPPGTRRRRSRSGIACLRDGDERAAERHLRCAAGGGSAEAAFRLATVLDAREPPPGPPELGETHTEKSECEEWYERAAEQGHRRAQVRVGMLAAARGDIVDAARWYREAAEAGSRNGAFNLGCCSPVRASERGGRPVVDAGRRGRARARRAAAGAARRPPGRAGRGPALVRARRGAGPAPRWRSAPRGCARRCTRSSRPDAFRLHLQGPAPAPRRPPLTAPHRDLRWSAA